MKQGRRGQIGRLTFVLVAASAMMIPSAASADEGGVTLEPGTVWSVVDDGTRTTLTLDEPVTVTTDFLTAETRGLPCSDCGTVVTSGLGPDTPPGSTVELNIQVGSHLWTCPHAQESSDCGTYLRPEGTPLDLHYTVGGRPAVGCTSTPWSHPANEHFTVYVTSTATTWEVHCWDDQGEGQVKHVTIAEGDYPPEYTNGRDWGYYGEEEVSWEEAQTALIGDDQQYGELEMEPTTQIEAVRCKYIDAKAGKGGWPYRREHWLGMYWCWNNQTNRLVSRRAHTWGRTPGSLNACNWHDAMDWRIGGGVGQNSIDIQSEITFTCLIPVFGIPVPVNDGHWGRLRYYAGGLAALLAEDWTS